MSAPAAVGALEQAREPSWVRHGSAATKQRYEAALAFERMLLQQLSQSLEQTAGLDESGEGEAQTGEAGEAGVLGGTGSADGGMSSLLSQALSESLAQDGGLGVAAQLAAPLSPIRPGPRGGDG